MGTPSYMAPEQAGGPTTRRHARPTSTRLGAILYELLTGRPPFRRETPSRRSTRSATQEPVPPRALQPKLPRDLETICLKCLQKDPAKRVRLDRRTGRRPGTVPRRQADHGPAGERRRTSLAPGAAESGGGVASWRRSSC